MPALALHTPRWVTAMTGCAASKTPFDLVAHFIAEGSPPMTQTVMHEILGEVSSNAPMLTSYSAKMNAILTHFAQRQIPLAVCADKQHLNRSVATLKKRARQLGLCFPDYIPRELARR